MKGVLLEVRPHPYEVEAALKKEWSTLEVLGLPSLLALLNTVIHFELMLATLEQFHAGFEVLNLVLSPKGLSMLVQHLLRNCTDVRFSRDELRALSWERLARARGYEEARKAVNFASLYANFNDLAYDDNIVWRLHNLRTAQAFFRDRTAFKERGVAIALWDELNYPKFLTLRRLVRNTTTHSLQDDAKAILEWQTGTIPLDDSWRLGGYNVSEWKKVLHQLVVWSLLAASQSVKSHAFVGLTQETDELAALVSSRTGIALTTVEEILDDLTMNPSDPDSNLPRTPLVRAGGFTATSPSILLLRKADMLLLRQWHRKRPTQYAQDQPRIVTRIHLVIKELLEKQGNSAWIERGYTNPDTGQQRDIDILAHDGKGNWLVIQVKAFLPPNPASENVQSREQYYKQGYEQIEDAIRVIAREPFRALGQGLGFKRRQFKFSSIKGLLVVTHALGVPPEPPFPTVELPVLRGLLASLRAGVLSLDRLTSQTTHYDLLRHFTVGWMTRRERDFLLRFPYVPPLFLEVGDNEWRTRLSDLVSKVYFLALRLAHQTNW